MLMNQSANRVVDRVLGLVNRTGATAKLPTAALRPLLEAVASAAHVPSWDEFQPGEWLEGLVLQESSGKPGASRYEPHLDVAGRVDARQDGDAPKRDDQDNEDDRSYGLMQVL